MPTGVAMAMIFRMETTHVDQVGTGSPLATVQALYEAFGVGDMEGILAQIDADVDWSVQVKAPGAELVPMFQNGRGHEAVLRYFSGVADMDFHQFEPRMMLEQGDTVIVVLAVDFTHKKTGKRGQFEEIHRFRVGATGKILRYRPFVDTATFIEVFRP